MKIVELFQLHPEITRTIGREVAHFSCLHQHGSEIDPQKIVCTARLSSFYSDDVAMSSAFFVQSGVTMTIFYGCSQRQRQDIIRRVDSIDPASNHPLLPAGLVTELERIRLGERVDDLMDHFTLKASSAQELELDMEKTKMVAFLKLCYESRDLSNQIRAAKRQIDKMGIRCALLNYDERVYWAGEQIRERLDEIRSEYDSKLDECNTIIENMSLTMQTAWGFYAREDNKLNLQFSRVNTELARTGTELTQDMKRDSTQMRSIGLLTMIFLPLSTVASVFSTTFFDWKAASGGAVVSEYIWIFAVIAVGLTSMVVGAWYLGTRRAAKRETAYEESQKQKLLGIGIV